MNKTIYEQFKHIYWIGGGSGAGKTTIARNIAKEYGFYYYSTDDVMLEHTKRSTPLSCPYLHKFMNMDIDERWVNRPTSTMLETFHWFRGEGFSMIIEDLLYLPKEVKVIVEGFRLLPHLVQPLLAEQSHAVWFLPSPTFREMVFDNRGGLQWGFVGKTSNPEQALLNLLERDALFTNRLYKETKELQMNVIQINNKMTIDNLTKQVKAIFKLS